MLTMLLCITLLGHAQATDVQMATLQHGNEVKVFYGWNALKDAYTAAADSGDVITLSAGTFSGLTIQKSLTIIGNGFVRDEEKGIYPTVIEDGMHFSSRDLVNEDGETIKDAIGYSGTRLEGLYIKTRDNSNFDFQVLGAKYISGFEIVKCYIGTRSKIHANISNLTIRQSVFRDISWNNQEVENLYIEGSYIENWYYLNSSSTVNIDHSLIDWNYLSQGTVTNSILRGANSNVTANNCIFIESTPTVLGTGNWFNKKLAGIFEEEMTNMNWDGVKTFKLKYPQTYVGTDGTEVGLYGGTYPFNPTPTVPQIKESEIDTKVAADGKLKVRITVEAQTEY